MNHRSKRFDPGKWAEDEARKWLEARSLADAHFAYHRYPDARSAQGSLSPQPADYLVAQGSKWAGKIPLAWHLEVKETAQETRLPKAKIRQYGLLKKFDWAGFRTVVLVFRSAFNDWVYLTSDDLFNHDEVPASFSMKGKKSFPTHAEALQEIFG